MKLKTLFSFAKWTSDDCVTVQLFFSIVYPRHLLFMCRIRVITIDKLTLASVHSFWKSPELMNVFFHDNPLNTAVNLVASAPYPTTIFFTIRITTLCEPPASLTMTQRRVSMILFCVSGYDLGVFSFVYVFWLFPYGLFMFRRACYI